MTDTDGRHSPAFPGSITVHKAPTLEQEIGHALIRIEGSWEITAEIPKGIPSVDIRIVRAVDCHGRDRAKEVAQLVCGLLAGLQPASSPE